MREISFQKEKNIVRVYFTENISVYKIYKNLNLLSSTILNLLKLNITIIIKKIELLYEDNKNKVILKYLDGYLTETLVADFDFSKSKILRIIKKKNTLVEIFPSFTKKIQSNFDLKEIELYFELKTIVKQFVFTKFEIISTTKKLSSEKKIKNLIVFIANKYNFKNITIDLLLGSYNLKYKNDSKLNEKDKQEIINMFLNRISIEKTSEIFNISKSKFYTILRKNKVKTTLPKKSKNPKNHLITKDEQKTIINLYKNGLGHFKRGKFLQREHSIVA